MPIFDTSDQLVHHFVKIFELMGRHDALFRALCGFNDTLWAVDLESEGNCIVMCVR